jgi:hypothetical protein
LKALQIAIVTMARYEAEEKIKARKRMLLRKNQQHQDPIRHGKGIRANPPPS